MAGFQEYRERTKRTPQAYKRRSFFHSFKYHEKIFILTTEELATLFHSETTSWKATTLAPSTARSEQALKSSVYQCGYYTKKVGNGLVNKRLISAYVFRTIDISQK